MNSAAKAEAYKKVSNHAREARAARKRGTAEDLRNACYHEAWGVFIARRLRAEGVNVFEGRTD